MLKCELFDYRTADEITGPNWIGELLAEVERLEKQIEEKRYELDMWALETQYPTFSEEARERYQRYDNIRAINCNNSLDVFDDPELSVYLGHIGVPITWLDKHRLPPVQHYEMLDVRPYCTQRRHIESTEMTCSQPLINGRAIFRRVPIHRTAHFCAWYLITGEALADAVPMKKKKRQEKIDPQEWYSVTFPDKDAEAGFWALAHSLCAHDTAACAAARTGDAGLLFDRMGRAYHIMDLYRDIMRGRPVLGGFIEQIKETDADAIKQLEIVKYEE